MKRRTVEDSGIAPTLPITPMLDMSFQLLAFFVMFYHPSNLEGQMQLALPANDAKAALKQEDVNREAKADKDPILEIPSDLVVKIKAQIDDVNRGMMNALVVETRTGPTAIANLEKLAEYLKAAHETVENKSAIKIEGDSRLKWDQVVQVMDVCRKAGFENISFAPPPDLGIADQ